MTAIALMNQAARKELARLQAECAIRGAELRVIESDDGRPEFVFTKRHRTQRFTCMDEVEGFLSAVSGYSQGKA